MINFEGVLNTEVCNLKPSGIRMFFDIVLDKKNVISLGIGEPDFVTPYNIRQAGCESLSNGRTFYSPNAGFFELRERICQYTKRKYDLEYCPKTQTMVTVGGSEAIDCAIRALINPGDEVIIPQPSFVCYEPIARLSRGVIVPIVTKEKDNFKVTAEQLKNAITNKTKLLIMPFPSNPTGAIMDKDDWAPICDLLKGTNIIVLSDEIYAELTYKDLHFSPAGYSEDMYQRTIVVNGFSKAFAMTGWRLGYAHGPAPIIAQMLKIHQYAIMSAPTTAQDAAIEALTNCDDVVKEMKEEYNSRRKMIVSELRRIGLDCFEPQGAFYVFPNISKFKLSSTEFCLKLLEEENVAIIPGNAFGESGEGYVRISYAYSTAKIQNALKYIQRFIERL